MFLTEFIVQICVDVRTQVALKEVILPVTSNMNAGSLNNSNVHNVSNCLLGNRVTPRIVYLFINQFLRNKQI